MRTYASSRDKRKGFYSKSDLQIYVFVDFRRQYWYTKTVPRWSLHTKLCKGAENVSANNSETIRATKLKTRGLNKLFIY